MMRSPRILVAEDNTINQKLIAHLLRKLAYEYIVVPDGKKALEQLELEPYDFVFMDLDMPVMNGFEATEEIFRLYSPTQRPVIIALTGNAEQSDRDACLKAGMKDFITKPISPENVKQIIERWFVP